MATIYKVYVFGMTDEDGFEVKTLTDATEQQAINYARRAFDGRVTMFDSGQVRLVEVVVFPDASFESMVIYRKKF